MDKNSPCRNLDHLKLFQQPTGSACKILFQIIHLFRIQLFNLLLSFYIQFLNLLLCFLHKGFPFVYFFHLTCFHHITFSQRIKGHMSLFKKEKEFF